MGKRVRLLPYVYLKEEAKKIIFDLMIQNNLSLSKLSNEFGYCYHSLYGIIHLNKPVSAVLRQKILDRFPVCTFNELFKIKDNDCSVDKIEIKEKTESKKIRKAEMKPEFSDDVKIAFDKLWEVYPRHENKKKALGIFERKGLVKDVDEIINRIMVLKESDPWKQGFVPHLTTFLNGERWNDIPHEISPVNHYERKVEVELYNSEHPNCPDVKYVTEEEFNKLSQIHTFLNVREIKE